MGIWRLGGASRGVHVCLGSVLPDILAPRGVQTPTTDAKTLNPKP